MANDGVEVCVGDLAESISDTHVRNKSRLIFLNTSDIRWGEILHQNYSDVRGWPGQAKKAIRRHDILFSEIRPANGRWAYVNVDAEDFVVSTKLMVIRARADRVYARFLYYFLTASTTTTWLQRLAESRSGTFPQITFDEVSSLRLRLPSPATQVEVAHFMDAVSEKLELNRRINRALEETARAIFKSWFVDFGPVRGEATIPEDIQCLFPNRLVDSPIGPIPEGWEVRPIGGLVRAVGGATPRTDNPAYWGGDVPFVTPRDLSTLSAPVILSTSRSITAIGLERIGSGLLGPGTVVLSSRAPIGYLAMSEVEIAVNQGIIAFPPSKSSLPPVFIFHWLATHMEDIIGNANGTTFPEISKKNFRPILCVKPPANLLARFCDVAEPIHRKITANQRESQTLAELRDTLLPKLVSGEIRVGKEQEAQRANHGNF